MFEIEQTGWVLGPEQWACIHDHFGANNLEKLDSSKFLEVIKFIRQVNRDYYIQEIAPMMNK